MKKIKCIIRFVVIVFHTCQLGIDREQNSAGTGPDPGLVLILNKYNFRVAVAFPT